MRETAFDLVPTTAQGSTLRTLLSRRQWNRIRWQSREEAGDTCELCGRRGRRVEGVRSVGVLEGHELWSYDDERKIQRLVSVQTVCPDCHQALHWQHENPPDPATSNRYHLGPALAMVEIIVRSGWDRTGLDEHHSRVIELWRVRSGSLWTLDTVAAERYGCSIGVLSPEQRLEVHPSSDMGKRLARNPPAPRTAPRTVGEGYGGVEIRRDG